MQRTNEKDIGNRGPISDIFITLTNWLIYRNHQIGILKIEPRDTRRSFCFFPYTESVGSKESKSLIRTHAQFIL